MEFQIGEQKTNSKQVAVNVKVLFRSTSSRCQGFVATLKENYGFIENDKHDQEFFFHFRSGLCYCSLCCYHHIVLWYTSTALTCDRSISRFYMEGFPVQSCVGKVCMSFCGKWVVLKCLERINGQWHWIILYTACAVSWLRSDIHVKCMTTVNCQVNCVSAVTNLSKKPLFLKNPFPEPNLTFSKGYYNYSVVVGMGKSKN